VWRIVAAQRTAFSCAARGRVERDEQRHETSAKIAPRLVAVPAASVCKALFGGPALERRGFLPYRMGNAEGEGRRGTGRRSRPERATERDLSILRLNVGAKDLIN
jgi:hypothetical protein